MKTKTILFIVGALAVSGAVYYFLVLKKSSAQKQDENTSDPLVIANQTPTADSGKKVSDLITLPTNLSANSSAKLADQLKDLPFRVNDIVHFGSDSKGKVLSAIITKLGLANKEKIMLKIEIIPSAEIIFLNPNLITFTE